MSQFGSVKQIASAELGQLVDSGVYRVSRNPQYAGYVLLLTGVAAALSAGAAAGFRWWISVEERYLRHTLGEPYRAYQRRTHRWLGLPQSGGIRSVSGRADRNRRRSRFRRERHEVSETNRTVVHDVAVLTADPDDTVYERGTIVIEDGRLTAVRPAEPGDDRLEAGLVIDGRGKLAMPGLVNAHAHMEMAGVQGAFSDLSTARLGLEVAALYHQREAYAELAQAGWASSLVSMLTSGITTVNSMDRDPRQAVGVVADSGMRAVLGPMLTDMLPEPVDEQLARAEEFITRYHDTAGGRLRAAVAPGGDWGCSRALWREAAELARRHPEVRVHTHVLETGYSQAIPRAQGYRSSMDLLDDLGLLDERTMLAHFVHAGAGDVRRAAAAGASVLHCPTAFSYYGTGAREWLPIRGLLDHGVSTGLGLDDPYWIDSYDLFREAKQARTVANFCYGAPQLDSPRLVRMLTIDGARALGLGDQVGSLEQGKRADLVLVDIDHPRFEPYTNLPALVVNSVTADRVDTVLVDGRVLVRGGRMQTLDEQAARNQLRQAARSVAGEIGWQLSATGSPPPPLTDTLRRSVGPLAGIGARLGWQLARDRVRGRT